MERERSGNNAQIARSAVQSVYFLEAAGTGLVKIGCAIDVAGRWADLSTMSPVPLSLLAVLPGGRDREQELHRLLREYRHHGEWFRRCQMMDDIMASPEALDLCAFAGRRTEYLGKFLDDFERKQRMAARSHDWMAMGNFRKCMACGRISFKGAKSRVTTCPGSAVGRRRIKKLVADHFKAP
jgi:hypothetical protein